MWNYDFNISSDFLIIINPRQALLLLQRFWQDRHYETTNLQCCFLKLISMSQLYHYFYESIIPFFLWKKENAEKTKFKIYFYFEEKKHKMFL